MMHDMGDKNARVARSYVQDAADLLKKAEAIMREEGFIRSANQIAQVIEMSEAARNTFAVWWGKEVMMILKILLLAAMATQGLAGRPDLAPVRITLGKPRRSVVEIAATVMELAPTGKLFGIEDRAEFTSAFFKKLDKIGLERIEARLNAVSQENGGRDLVLLCFEDVRKPGEWCTAWCLPSGGCSAPAKSSKSWRRASALIRLNTRLLYLRQAGVL